MRVLLVGCGGIGCEVAKLLALRTPTAVHLVDLDTIELSNLNRQFIFQSSDIGKHKARVLADWLGLRYKHRGLSTRVTYSLEPVPNEACGPSFVSEFDVVINALDNIAARSTMNKLCRLAWAMKGEGVLCSTCRVYVGEPHTGVPLIDAGTSGIRGTCITYYEKTRDQQPWHACFDCFPPPPPKSLPVCTVRTFPTSPEHCITFALNAFQRLFGEGSVSGAEAAEKAADAGDMLDMPHLEVHTWLEGNGVSVNEKHALEDVIAAVNVLCSESVSTVAHMTKDTGMFSSPPVPLDPLRYDGVLEQLQQQYNNTNNNQSITEMVQKVLETYASLPQSPDQAHAMNMPLLLVCSTLAIGLEALKNGSAESFTKDNNTHLLYLVAFSVLRMRSFSIHAPSPFDIVGIGGNVIPAVATTNAATAGLAVTELDALLQNNYCSHETFISPVGKPLFTLEAKEAAPACPTCANPAIVIHSSDENTSILDMPLLDVIKDATRVVCSKWPSLKGSVGLFKGGVQLNTSFTTSNLLGNADDKDDKRDDEENDEENFWDESDKSEEGDEEMINKKNDANNTISTQYNTLRDAGVSLARPLSLIIGEQALLVCLE